MPLRASLNTHFFTSCELAGVGRSCQLRTPERRKRKNYFILGLRRLTRLMMLRPLTGIISLNSAFVRSDVRRRRWLLPPFVRTSLPEPVRRNRFEVALWVFSLYLPVFALRGITVCSFQTKYTVRCLFQTMTLYSHSNNIMGIGICYRQQT